MEKIFYLSKEQIQLSKEYYNGKIIKCLIAPYHSYSELKDVFKEGVHIFPERDLSLLERKSFINNLVNDDNIQEATIVTSCDYIILDMIDTCVRILTIDEEIVRFPTKTFRANRLEIENFIFRDNEHDEYTVPEEVDSYCDIVITKLIDDINQYVENKSTISKEDFDSLNERIELIGDSFLKSVMKTQCEKIKIK